MYNVTISLCLYSVSGHGSCQEGGRIYGGFLFYGGGEGCGLRRKWWKRMVEWNNVVIWRSREGALTLQEHDGHKQTSVMRNFVVVVEKLEVYGYEVNGGWVVVHGGEKAISWSSWFVFGWHDSCFLFHGGWVWDEVEGCWLNKKMNSV